MYQSIDDDFDEDETATGGLSAWPFIWGGLAAAIVFGLVWLSSPGTPIGPGRTVAEPETRAAYRKAISAPTAALRRARLLDYQEMNPDAANARAVQAQLDVITASEAEAWEATLAQAYNVRAEDTDKLAALEAYARAWPPELLGGRGEAVAALRDEIQSIEAAQPLPDRSLPDIASAIPDNVPADQLAGGPRPAQIYVPPVKAEPVPRPVTVVQTAPVIVPPSVRRNVSPRYPRKAMRRGIDAVVTLSLSIDDNGRVAMTEVLSVEADRYEEDFVKAAVRAAKRTRFNPQTQNGEPVSVAGIRKRYRFKGKD